jgi:hypothetical protein
LEPDACHEDMNATNDMNANCNCIDECQSSNDSSPIHLTPKKVFVSPDANTPTTSTCTATTVATSTCTTASIESIDTDGVEHLPFTVNQRQISLQYLIAGRKILRLPWHAVELGSFAGNHVKPIGATKIFREEIRGERRVPNRSDLYNNVYGQLLRRLAMYRNAPQETDDLFFVRRIKGGMKKSEEDPSAPIYQLDEKYFERIVNCRDVVVKKYINERRYSAPKVQLPGGAGKVARPPLLYLQTPLASGPCVHMETPALSQQLSHSMETSTNSGTHPNLESPSLDHTTPASESRLYMGSLPPTFPPLLPMMNPKPVPRPLPLCMEAPSPSIPLLDSIISPPIGQLQRDSTLVPRPALQAESPQICGPSLHTESSPIAGLAGPPLHPYLADFLLAARCNFEDFCREHDIFRQTHATRNFEALLKGAESATGEMNDEAMVCDYINFITKYWNKFFEATPGNDSSTGYNPSSDSDYEDGEFEDDYGRGSFNWQSMNQGGSHSNEDHSNNTSGSKKGNSNATPHARSLSGRKQGRLAVVKESTNLHDEQDQCNHSGDAQGSEDSLKNVILDRNTCNTAAETGNLALLQRAHRSACPWDAETCEKAAKHGHLVVLQWAHQHDCPWDIWACAAAAKHGHKVVLQWLHKHGCPWDERTCAHAAESGNLEILQWARENGCPWDQWTCTNAAKNGHLHILQWARDNKCPWNSETCSYAAMNGHLDVLQWARINGCTWNSYVVSMAMKNNHLAVSKWAQANGCPQDADELPPFKNDTNQSSEIVVHGEAIAQLVDTCQSVHAVPLERALPVLRADNIITLQAEPALPDSNDAKPGDAEQNYLRPAPITLPPLPAIQSPDTRHASPTPPDLAKRNPLRNICRLFSRRCNQTNRTNPARNNRAMLQKMRRCINHRTTQHDQAPDPSRISASSETTNSTTSQQNSSVLLSMQ